MNIQRGCPFQQELTIYESDSVTPIDLKDKVVYISVKSLRDRSVNDERAVISSKIEEHVDESAGVTLWELSAEDTSVKIGIYKADIRVYTSDEIFINSPPFTVNVIPIVTMRKT